MNGELFAKCGCGHCGNHIEFPFGAAGAEVQCPHCGQPTVLSLQGPPAAEGVRPSAGELVAAFGGPVPRTRVSPFYQMGLVLVTVMMILLPLAYLALVAATIYGVYAYATHFSFLLHSTRGGARFYVGRLLLYFAPLFGGAVLVFFMVKPLLARRAPHAQPLALNPALSPALYAFIARVCDLVGAPMPRRIDLVCDLNAAAGFRRGAASLLGNDLVLTIGLPLVAGLNLQQFAGVIAHEFGHFAQGFGMRLSYIIRCINGWFVRVVYERDAWDIWLEEMGMEAQDAGILIVVNCARLGVGTSRLVLKLLMLLAHAFSCFLLRQMEYDADSYSIKVAGSGATEAATRRMAELGEALDRSYKDIRTTWNLSRRLPEDFPAYLVAQHAKLPAALCRRIQDRLGLARTRLFDTHPSDGDRIRRARQAGDPGVFHLELPASILLSHFAIISKQVTHLHYEEDLGLVFDAANLRPVEGLAPPSQEM